MEVAMSQHRADDAKRARGWVEDFGVIEPAARGTGPPKAPHLKREWLLQSISEPRGVKKSTSRRKTLVLSLSDLTKFGARR